MGPPSTGRVGKDGRRNQSQNQNQNQNQKNKKDGSKKKKPQQHRMREGAKPNQKKESSSDELSRSIPIPLQQLMLNIFRCALLFSNPEEDQEESQEGHGKKPEQEPLVITPLIQTLKTHLYNRDFLSAFADADEDLLRAYALRWSAGRALGYVGVLDGVWRNWVSSGGGVKRKRRHAVCIGGGAGAEIVALAGVWRMLRDEVALDIDSAIDEDISKLSVRDNPSDSGEQGEAKSLPTSEAEHISITAVDIADWSPVVNRLSKAIKSPSVPSTKSCRAPLLPSYGDQEKHEDTFNVSFKHLDVLSLSDKELQPLLCPKTNNLPQNQGATDLVTLMFTLNELFSTSIPKTTSFLLRMTDLLEPGTILLVVDSPGSYSTVALGKKGEEGDKTSSSQSTSNTNEDGNSGASTAPSQQQKPRTYPMRLLLDHTLLSVASGCWECVLSDESRWFRREAAKLSYDVGEGIGLEDMRFQVHVYRRLKG
ncbi:hypothetical protein FQN54_009126 [Arachnomyces sp. PD_36]|nr:hypothetical protein FQN54_009126 [Arachnomyces sp. PD_36]